MDLRSSGKITDNHTTFTTIHHVTSYNKNCVKVYGLKKILHSYLIRYGINFQLATCKEYLNGQQPRKAIFVDESLG